MNTGQYRVLVLLGVLLVLEIIRSPLVQSAIHAMIPNGLLAAIPGNTSSSTTAASNPANVQGSQKPANLTLPNISIANTQGSHPKVF